MPGPIYVTGHVNPDTDSIVAALGYAWLLRERDRVDAAAARAGALNPQTAWVLKTLNLESPILLTDASPRFESVARRLDTTLPDRPLKEAWAIASRTGGLAPVLNPDGSPYGLLTGRSFFDYLTRLIGPHPQSNSQTIAQILEQPCREAADREVLAFQASARIRDNLPRLLRQESDEFWVVDEAGHYFGVCRQGDLLHPPRLRLVLVDHNEASQSVPSLEEAELLEIIDHHRLGNPSTHAPIRFTVDVVGSTSTLVAEKIIEAGLSAPPLIAGAMLAGVLSDTLLFTSPTTTSRDKIAAERLGRSAFAPGSPLASETLRSFGEKVIAAGAGLGLRTPDEIMASDLKIYSAGGFHFSISQVEVSSLYEIGDHLQPLQQALSSLRLSKALDFSMLLVTDVVRGSSRVVLDNPPPLLDDLPYQPLEDGTLLAEGIVSRKKQLLPVILGLLEA